MYSAVKIKVIKLTRGGGRCGYCGLGYAAGDAKIVLINSSNRPMLSSHVTCMAAIVKGPLTSRNISTDERRIFKFVARKHNTCRVCKQPIEVGQKMIWMVTNRLCSAVMHPQCIMNKMDPNDITDDKIRTHMTKILLKDCENQYCFARKVVNNILAKR